MNESESLFKRLEAFIERSEMLKLSEFLHYAQNWKKRLLFDFFGGIARGVGFSIGFTLLGALILYFLKNAALANLPVIGQFLGELLHIAEES